MAEVSQVDPNLLEFIQQQTSNVSTNDPTATVRPESLNLGSRSRRQKDRAPFVLTCDSFARAGRYIVLWCNPTNWNWTYHQRGSVVPTRGGRIFEFWRDLNRDTYFDEAQVAITFQSGNIMPIRTVVMPDGGSIDSNSTQAKQFGVQGGGSPSTIIAPGLLNFYEYLELKDERKFLDDGSINYTSIIASTPMFPTIVLKGFFNPDGGPTWQENAEDPNAFDWTDTFTVVQTYPRVTNSVMLRSVFQQMSGKSDVARVLIDKNGLRRDSNGNIVFNSGARATTSARNPPNFQTQNASGNQFPSVDPTGNRPNEVAVRDSEIQRLQTIPENQRTSAQSDQLAALLAGRDLSQPLTLNLND